MHNDNSRGVHRVALSYSLVPDAPLDDLVLHPLIQMLDAVERRGSISAAARTLGLSYRHVWGELKRWEESFGRLLIVWEKGQKARLTSFGQKLLWAERQAQSRLAPQIAALRADLERAFGMAFDDEAHVMPASASHDDALAAFRQHAQASGVYLDLRFSGSLDALSAMGDGRVNVAGFHLPVTVGGLDPSIRQALVRQFREALGGVRAQALPFARRQQGLMVEPGNPLKVRSLEDLLSGRFRFVNRGPGAGTRLILDAWLAQQKVGQAAIKGYRHEEPSHAAVAEAVRTGLADVGLGLASVAQGRGLGFVPLFEEDYWLAVRMDGINESAVKALLGELASARWRAALSEMPGYQPLPLAEPCSLGVALA
ncbi:MAG: substrate-binding domain-containing protein [Burkholderiaceae bacterium]